MDRDKLSYVYTTTCPVCGRTFSAPEDSQSENLKMEHMASEHSDYMLVKGYGWVRKANGE